MRLLQYQTLKDIIGWDIVNWSKSLAVWDKYINDKTDLNVLTLGDRNGGLALWFALKRHSVFATDRVGISEKCINIHKNYKFDKNIKYEKADMMNLNYDNNSFDIVAFKSVLGGLKTLENQATAISEINRVLKPNGLLLFAENAFASPIHIYFRKRQNKFKWKYLKEDELALIIKPMKIIDIKYYGFFGTFGRTEKQKYYLGHLDNYLSFFIPKSFKYINIYVCKK
tara:strand:+ start:388 stop:1065 length:678 start_codon:yes stop_codon:yes gene_type:complete